MIKTPEELFGPLYEALHIQMVLDDGKAISDAIPKYDPALIVTTYQAEKDKASFDLKAFFHHHFEVASTPSSDFVSNSSHSVEQHIERLWDVLARQSDEGTATGDSRIPLPYPYIVPGGRFNEIYYWDSYFTMLGLRASGRTDMIKNMLNNFSFMIDSIGHIPNGNRSYFASRSQPPFFALMVQLLAEKNGDKVYLTYLKHLELEYEFWMEEVNSTNNTGHAVEVPGGILNRYFDTARTPRAEMFAEDLQIASKSSRDPETVYRHIRAACESGWDFSWRWFSPKGGLDQMITADLCPIDLNCLLYQHELILSKAHGLNQDIDQAKTFALKAKKRRNLIRSLLWNTKIGFFNDYNYVDQNQSSKITAAGAFALFCNIASEEEAKSCVEVIKNQLLRPGGIVTTAQHSGQQWDAPNGWAPLQWIVIQGLRNYGYQDLANEISRRWTKLNSDVFSRTGKLLEKYNVEDTSKLSGGGEYPVQDGFGWTNGVLLALLKNNTVQT